MASTQPFNMQDFTLPGEPENSIDYQEGSSNVDEVDLAGNASVDDNDVFTYPSDMDITKNMSDLYDIVNYHDSWLAPKYKVLSDYVKGRHHTILDKDAPYSADKPDSRMIVNFPKKLVDSFNGYQSGNPVAITLASDDDDENKQVNDMISSWLNQNSYSDTFSELNRTASIFGRSYLYIYQDGNDIKFTTCTPLDTIVIYDDTVAQHPLFAIRYEEDGDGSFDGTLITKEGEYNFNPTNSVGSVGKDLKLKTQNYGSELQNNRSFTLPTLPVIEMVENNQRVSTFGDVINLIDSTNDILSQKNNDNHALSNSYMVVSGIKLSDQQKADMQKNHIINLYPQNQDNWTDTSSQPPISVDFKSPSPDDQMQEHTIDRNISLIYQIAQVVDLNDPQSGVDTASSGTALKQLYQAMKAKAESKNSKFDKLLHDLLMNMFTIWGIDTDYVSSVQYHHQLAEPSNISEETTAFKNLQGSQVPLATQLSYLSKVEDPQSTADQIKSNSNDNNSNVQDMINKAVDNNRRNGNASDNSNNNGNNGNNGGDGNDNH